MLKKVSSHLFATFVAGTLLFALSGCTGKSQPARFYSLTPQFEDTMIVPQNGSPSTVSLGIGPVKIADYLDQNRVITRSGDNNRIEKSEFDLWSGSLKDNIANVVAENMSHILSTDMVSMYPWGKVIPIDYQVAVYVIRLDGQLGHDAVLVTRWRVFNGKEKKLLVQKRSEIHEKAGSGYEDMAAAQSMALSRLCQEIAETIVQLANN